MMALWVGGGCLGAGLWAFLGGLRFKGGIRVFDVCCVRGRLEGCSH